MTFFIKLIAIYQKFKLSKRVNKPIGIPFLPFGLTLSHANVSQASINWVALIPYVRWLLSSSNRINERINNL